MYILFERVPPQEPFNDYFFLTVGAYGNVISLMVLVFAFVCSLSVFVFQDRDMLSSITIAGPCGEGSVLPVCDK